MIKENRRVRRTKGSIQKELIILLQKHRIEDISVTQLCDSVPINRSTFYAHYGSTMDVLLEIEHDIINLCSDYLYYYQLSDDSEQDKLFKLYMDVVNYVKDNVETVKVMFHGPVSHKFINDLVYLSRQRHVYTQSCGNDYQEFYTIAGIISVIQVWIHRGLDLSPQQISEILLDMGPTK
ncbi:TetR/AcrR family transcriptional regulator [Bombilactobacillus folatiphilus]|uniref:TetR/AcrR family transcriptional regulator n=1 Tax=Bombilactobacillus folatiphilus TaxID=2923362 RepID=A0ABY4P8U2_9LACO|nr:TetR/AcrR family transcriptional regulator [Bombilactobacillus folatiphilus]UQS81951.1 TetR/AcrR family transcriptional regulator [Bombilactobacillus folatiphilus]